MTTVVNMPFMNSLSAEHQRIIREAAKEASVSAWETYIKSVDNDRQTLRNLGVTVTTMTESERLRFLEAIQPTLNRLYAENDWAGPMVEKIGNVR
jgi:TRAP-type C4-dicarboxylate transport system substrate-binding protein